MRRAEKKRRKALVAALPWDPSDTGPWRLDAAVTARQQVVVRYCRAKGCRTVDRKRDEPCSRCGGWQSYGQDALMACVRWTYRPEAIAGMVAFKNGDSPLWKAMSRA